MGKGWLDTTLKYNGGEDGEEVAAQQMCKYLVHRFREPVMTALKTKKVLIVEPMYEIDLAAMLSTA